MTDYAWHIATLGGMNADEPHHQAVIVLAWHGDTASVIDVEPNDGPVIGSSPRQVPIGHLRFGWPPE